MNLLHAVDAEVEPDYFQFYAMRSGSPFVAGNVPEIGFERHLWTDGGFVYLGTARKYGTTKVRMEVLDAAPTSEPADEWQHVVEVSLEPGGDLELYSWGEDTPDATVTVDPGPLRLRVSWRGLLPDLPEGLDDDGESDEELLLQVWPASPSEFQVIRSWAPWDMPVPTDRSPDGRRQIEGLESVMPRLSGLTVVGRLDHAYPPMPGGEPGSCVYSVLTDPQDGSWWVDGNDVRRTLREVSEAEARALLDSQGRATGTLH